MEWIIENWDGIVYALGAILAAAKAIANLTPTEEDNNFLGKVGKAIDKVVPNKKKGGGRH